MTGYTSEGLMADGLPTTRRTQTKRPVITVDRAGASRGRYEAHRELASPVLPSAAEGYWRSAHPPSGNPANACRSTLHTTHNGSYEEDDIASKLGPYQPSPKDVSAGRAPFTVAQIRQN